MDTMELSRSNRELQKQRSRPYRSNKFEIPNANFFEQVSKSDYWFPEEITPWFYLPSYKALSPEVRQRYNQLYAVTVNEIFGILEKEFLVPTLRRISNQTNCPLELQQSLQHFIQEEEKHATMFEQLNQAAAPDFYRTSAYFISTQANQLGLHLLSLVSRWPHVFAVWVWFAVYFEERTIFYSKQYLKKGPRPLCKVFTEVHRLHMLEEVEHVQLDEILVSEFYQPLGFFKKQLCSFMFKKVIQSFSAPRRTSMIIAKLLKQEFPNDHYFVEKCLQELPKLKKCQEFQNLYFGPKAAPRTWKLLKKHPEMLVDLK